ncbi:hypothetical protein P692DRAFT_201792203 [Suillus brevipes Sb2]|nr:hypothetical protein P692DRAFT_201792203 [Suillus brevipes Sb2]
MPDILTLPTYIRVFKYLKIVVEAEFKSKHNSTLKGKTAVDVREAFVRQFERYVKGQYPFDVMVDAGQGILSYWTHLTKIPEGCILACVAEKNYSIKPSSIPEERTMSVFMRMNTPARNRQHVRTLVDMTQIRQWHMYDPVDANLHAPIVTKAVTKALSDECKESLPVDGLGGDGPDGTEDDADLEDKDTEWGGKFW